MIQASCPSTTVASLRRSVTVHRAVASRTCRSRTRRPLPPPAEDRRSRRRRAAGRSAPAATHRRLPGATSSTVAMLTPDIAAEGRPRVRLRSGERCAEPGVGQPAADHPVSAVRSGGRAGDGRLRADDPGRTPDSTAGRRSGRSDAADDQDTDQHQYADDHHGDAGQQPAQRLRRRAAPPPGPAGATGRPAGAGGAYGFAAGGRRPGTTVPEPEQPGPAARIGVPAGRQRSSGAV